MRDYYGTRFSPNMTQTPEGFLICHNVPIARAGWYQYLGEEIGLPEQTGKLVQVYRSPEEVFSPAAMASFEGKVLTDGHPPVEVTPDNAMMYTRGVSQNVRQGTGTNADLLIADLVVYDKALIDEIQAGKREVSCGYDFTCVPRGDGTYEQKQIVGNHVAVVQNGRAGDRVAIKDSQANPQPKGAMEMTMAKKLSLPKQPRQQKKRRPVTDFLAAVGLKHFATDAEPEEVMEAVDAMAEEQNAEDDDDEKQEQQPLAASTKGGQEQQPATDEETQDPALAALSAKVDKLTEIVTQLAQGGANKGAAPEDAIDAAIAELEGQATDENNEEESHTIPAEAMDENSPISEPEDRPQSAFDAAAKINALKAIKPILAAIPDPKERQKAADAAIKSVMGGKSTSNTYAKIQNGQQKTVKDQQPGAPAKTQDLSNLGREWAKQFNPHYKNRA